MRLTDILQPECVKVPVVAADKRGAIFELADLLVDHTGIRDREGFKNAVWKREAIRTTGIGHGIAIPHGKTAGVDRVRLAVGRTVEPLDFEAIDKKPVSLIFLLASPDDHNGPHIQALGRISRMLFDEALRQSMLRADSGDALLEMIQQYERNAAG